MSYNEQIKIIKKDGRFLKMDISRNVAISDDKQIRVHKVYPGHGIPAHYSVEQYKRINLEDSHGFKWCEIVQIKDALSAAAFIQAYNAGNKSVVRAYIRNFQRFDCPISL